MKKSSKPAPAAAKKHKSNQEMDVAERIFNALDIDSRGYVLKAEILGALHDRGILSDDVRIRQTVQGLAARTEKERITLGIFRLLVAPHITLIEKALTGNLVIPDFKNFASFVTNLYNRTLQNKQGEVSGYIPELANVDPQSYALSVCTVDGQRFNIGDCSKKYLARETANVVNYCMALKEHDVVEIHQKVGREPKERGFDYLMLNVDSLPHNPLTGAGALMTGSLVKQSASAKNRFAHVDETWKEMAGGIHPGFDEKAYDSENRIADKDRALAYFMQQKDLFPKGTNVNRHLEFLWRSHAIQTTTEAQAIMAATLANAGVCPTNEREVLTPNIAKNALSIMLMAGMGDHSSEHAFSVGLPAMSGISGVVMIVVPDVMGIVIWSPRVDKNGVSVKGVDFSRKLVERFNFHNFDTSIKNIGKVDPRLKKNETKMKGVMAVTSAASIGDLDELQRLYAAGVDLNEGEYDKRTGIHLAASEGHIEAVKFFIEKEVDVNPKDRWGGTPMADAKREGHKEVMALLKKHGGRESA
jgi:glutaminase